MPYWDTPTGGAILRLTITLLSQDVAANTSRIRRALSILSVGSTTERGDPVSCSVTGAGASASDTFTWAKGTSSKTILASDDTVEHGADGKLTLSNINGSIGATGTTGIGGPTTNGPRSYTLPTIPRASASTFVGGVNFDAGAPVTINTNRASTSFTHDIRLYFGTLSDVPIASGVGASTVWTPDMSLLEQIPNATVGNGFIRTWTYSGSETVGKKDTYFNLQAPATVVPVVDTISAADDNPDVASIVGKFVQGLSRAKLTVAGSGVYGSTITTAEATLLGATVPSGGTVAVTQSGNLAVTGKVTDSRGRVGTSSGTLPVLAYAPPKATAYQVRRCTSAGAVQDEGTYLRVDLTAAISSLINSTERNALTIRAFTRPHTAAGDGPWTARNVLTPGGVSYATWFLMSGGGIFSTTSSWDVRVQVHDKFGVFIADTAVSTITVTLDMNGPNVGVGKIWEQGALDVAGQIYQAGQKVIDASNIATTTTAGIVPLATVAQAQAGTDGARAVTPADLAGLILRVGSAVATSGDQSGIAGTTTEITGTSVSFTLATAGTVTYTGVLSTYSSAATDLLIIRVRDDTTLLHEFTEPANSSPTSGSTTRTHVVDGELTLPAGTHRLNLAVVRVVGTGTITVAKSATSPSRLTVNRVI